MTLPRSKARRFVRGFRPYRRYRLEGGRIVVLNSKGRRIGTFDMGNGRVIRGCGLTQAEAEVVIRNSPRLRKLYELLE